MEFVKILQIVEPILELIGFACVAWLDHHKVKNGIAYYINKEENDELTKLYEWTTWGSWGLVCTGALCGVVATILS